MKDAEGQIIIPLPSCPVGYERNSSGVCVPLSTIKMALSSLQTN
jgi:hypothetical protein